jgi:sugar transferase (PEP-CTERM/EpsH1 system associated)
MNAILHVEHVVLTLQPGGLENGVVNVANLLPRNAFRSSICCLRDVGEFASRLHPSIDVHKMYGKGGADFRLMLSLIRHFRRTRPDIVHTRNAEAFFYGFIAAKVARIPVLVHSEHGRDFEDRFLRFVLQRIFSKFTQVVFAVTEELRRQLSMHTGIPAESIRVLYNGVDSVRFSPASRGKLRSQLGVADNTLVIGSVGRLVEVKNYSLLLSAYKALSLTNTMLILIGEGPERASLELLARSLGISDRVRLLGHRDDVSELISVLDVFVLPSVSEGMSNTLLEAMSAGIAVVASAVGGNKEIIRSGVDGLLFTSGDEIELKENILLLLADEILRNRLSQAGRVRVLECFSIDAMINRYGMMYSEVFSLQKKNGKID